MRYRLLIFFFLMTLPLTIGAQLGTYYKADKQLLSSLTSKIIQDDAGRIWIGTRNGLNVYDGYQFQVYRKENQNNLGLNSNYINYVYQDNKGVVYVGMNDGLQIFKNDHFSTVKTVSGNRTVACYVNCICQLKNGSVLIGTSGYGIMKMVGDTTAERLLSQNNQLSYIKCLLEDKDRNLWISTEDKGIYIIKGNKVMACQTSDNSKGPFFDLCQDNKGDIYAANINGGLYKLSKSTYTFNPIQGTENIPLAAIYLSKNGTLLLGTDGMGLLIFDPFHESLTKSNFYSREIDLNHVKAHYILEDNNGNIWLSMLQKGIFMQPTRHTGFNYIGHKSNTHNSIGDACVMCTKFGKDGTIWVATDKGGLYALNRNGSLRRHYAAEKGDKLFPATILSIDEDNENRIWLGTYFNGCGWLDKNTGTYHRLACSYGKANNVFDVRADRNGNIWIGTMGDGLKRLNTETGQITTYREDRQSKNSLANNYIGQMYLSADSRHLYVGTSVGLSCLNTVTGSWTDVFGKNLILDNKYVSDIREDADKNLWIGTSEGVYYYNVRARGFKKYTFNDGLADNNVASIEIDRKGKVWISTGHGLSCLNPLNHKMENFYTPDGLQGNEFSEGVSSLNGQGIILFGGMEGITIFDPLKIKQEKSRLTVWLTNFSVGGNTVFAGMKSGKYTITGNTVISSKRFELNHNDNTFSLSLSTLTFDNSDRITYFYSMNGEPWNKLQQGSNSITFSHLPSGTYKYRIKATDNDTESGVREFTVVVHPPWFLSFPAVIVYCVLLVLAFLWYVKMRRHKMQERLRLQEHIHAEQLSEAKLKFFMNISHEIRTPMTLILTPLLSLMKEDNDPHRYGIYEIIRRNSERILHLINQMMDMRKIDKGQMVMHMKETDFISFVNDVYTLFKPQATAKNIVLQFNHDSDRLPVWIDRSNFDKIVMNILSNAFKFTHSGGKIAISITHDAANAYLSVKDDGESIPADKLDKIFERFYQSVSRFNNSNIGTGIGLDLTRSLVELHHGSITAQNNTDESGCEFIVTIPLGKTHLKTEELAIDSLEDEKGTLAETELTDVLPLDNSQRGTAYGKPGKKVKVAIVEDDDEIKEYLNNELGNSYTIVKYNNGLQALNGILKDTPDLIISDVMMPQMDGNTLCAKLKSNINTSHIPVILLTARNRDEDKLEGLETGADAYIVKPFNMDILRRTVINLLNERKRLRIKYSGNENQDDKVENIKVLSPDEKLLERVMGVINKHLNNSDLNVDIIADEVGISRVHLYRKMKDLTNQTPHDFIKNIRLKQAANLLTGQNQNITEVMYACGFSNAASFSTMFKKFYGVTPRDYAREHQKNDKMAQVSE